jgi:hypothetical protein
MEFVALSIINSAVLGAARSKCPEPPIVYMHTVFVLVHPSARDDCTAGSRVFHYRRIRPRPAIYAQDFGAGRALLTVAAPEDLGDNRGDMPLARARVAKHITYPPFVGVGEATHNVFWAINLTGQMVVRFDTDPKAWWRHGWSRPDC